jgi:DNA-binding transcriptional LysR family regulator
MIEVRRLRLLQELDAHGTVTGAATALRITPSAVSQQLAVLAREAGTEVIERDGRRVRLTGAGRVLLGHAHKVVAQLEAARADLDAHAARESGIERACGFASSVQALLAPAAARVRAAHPRWRLELSERETEDSLPLLLAYDIDLALVMSSSHLPPADDPRIELEPLVDDPFDALLPAGHPLADAAEITLDMLAGEDWTASGPGTACREVLVGGCRHVGFQPRIRHSATDFSAQTALVAAGLGVTVIPRLHDTSHVPGLVRRELTGFAPTRQLYAAVRRGYGDTPLRVAVRAEARRRRRSATTSANVSTDSGAR